jgi:hypothetical protein
MSGRDSVTEAQRKAVVDAFLRRQAAQQAREAEEAAEVEAIYQKALDAGEKPPTPRAIREAVAARDAAAAKAERERDGAAARRIVGVPTEAAAAPGPGPKPMVARGTVETTRRDLETEGEPSGERSIATRLGVSRDAVRYALGKDRRRPRA